MYAPRLVVQELGRGDRYVDFLQLRFTAYGFEYAHHLVRQPANVQVFAQRLLLAEKEAANLRADHTYLPPLLDVRIVQVAPAADDGLFQVLVTRVRATNVERRMLAAIADGKLTPQVVSRRNVVDLREITDQRGVVVVHQLHVSSGATAG